MARCIVFALLKKFISEDDGATVIEYGLIATMIGLAIIGSARVIGETLVSTFLLLSSAF